MKKFLLLFTFLFVIPEILADKRAPKDQCYISIGYVSDRDSVTEFAKRSFIKAKDFELFERKDKKVYLTLGKIDKNLFKKLESEGETYDFNCSSGKGYEERFGLNSEFQIVGGNKINIISAQQFMSVVSSIEIEKKRLVDIEVEKQVQAKMAALEEERVAKEVAEKEKQRKEEEEAKKEKQRLAELERKRKVEEEAEKEKQRLAVLEVQKKEQEAERQRLANLEKQKIEEKKSAELKKEALSLGFSNVEEMRLADYYENKGTGTIKTVLFCGNQKKGIEVFLSGEEGFNFSFLDITGRGDYFDFERESHSVEAFVVPIRNGAAAHTAISTYYLKTNLKYYSLESTFSGYLNWYEHGSGGSIAHKAPNYKLFRDGSGLEVLYDYEALDKYNVYPHPLSSFDDFFIKPCSPMQDIDGNELAAKRLGGYSKFMEAKYNKIVEENNKKEAALKAKSKF